MLAKLKSGRVISGRLAETFTRIGIAQEIDGTEKPKAKKGRKPKSK